MSLTRSCTFIVPALNEAASVGAVVDEILAAAPGAGLVPAVVLVVDDGSTDDTWETVLAACTRHPGQVHGLRLRRNCGKSIALAAGLERARTELVATLDADGQDDPAELARLRHALDNGLDLATGAKSARQDPWSRRVASQVFNLFVRAFTGLPLRDINSGLKLMRGPVAAELAPMLQSEWHRFLPVLAHARGFRVGEVPVAHRRRQHGRSRFGLERYARGAFDLAIIAATLRYGRRPGHFFAWLATGAGAAGGAILAYLSVLWFLGERPIGNRPLFFLGILLVVLGVQFFSLGFLAELHRPSRTAPPGPPIADERPPRASSAEAAERRQTATL